MNYVRKKCRANAWQTRNMHRTGGWLLVIRLGYIYRCIERYHSLPYHTLPYHALPHSTLPPPYPTLLTLLLLHLAALGSVVLETVCRGDQVVQLGLLALQLPQHVLRGQREGGHG